MLRPFVILSLTLAIGLCTAAGAAAQPIGVYSWQLQPYCNVLTFAVTQVGTTFALDGYDDQCGAPTRAPAVGVATLNPNGTTVQLGVTVVATPSGESRHIDAVVDLATISGTWHTVLGYTGTFALNASTGGPLLPDQARSMTLTNFGASASIHARRVQGAPGLPTAVMAGQQIASFIGEGYTGNAFGQNAAMVMEASENWAFAARGTRILFTTTPNGSTIASTRLFIDNNGNVGVGTSVPSQRLHVNGAARIGSCTYEIDGDVACVSDARFKDDVRGVGAMLDRVTALRPVRFHWRADAFTDQAFPAHESTGLIAQDVERVLPELVTTGADGYKSVNYGRLPLLAVQSLTELKARHDALDRRNADLERRLADLEAALAALTKPR